MQLIILLAVMIAVFAVALAFRVRDLWRQSNPGGHTSHKRRLHARIFLRALTAPFAAILSPAATLANWVSGPPQLALANTYNMPVIDREGEGRYFSDDSGITTPWLLYKRGSDENHVTLAGAGDKPLGTSPDKPKLAGDQLAIWYLGNHEGTLFGVASGAIAAGDLLVPAANGKVQTLPAGAGTYYVVGEALCAAVDGQHVTFVHRYPYPPTVQV